MKTIMITISRGSLIRNFFHTGIISRLLSAGIRVIVLTPFYKEKELFKDYSHKNLILEPLHEPNVRFRRLIIELYKGIVFNKTIFVRYRFRLAGNPPNKFLFIPRMLFIAWLRFIPGLKKIFRYIEFYINPQVEHDYILKKYNPDLVFSTSLGNCDSDSSVLKGAKRFGVKTVCMPKSWDNLSKGLFSVKADILFVWSDFMKKQAIRFQDYSKSEVVVTGVPQFDFYIKKELLLSREEFCKQFRFDPEKKIILYGSTGGNCVNEQIYLDFLNNAIQSEKLSNAQVLVRPHLGYVGDKDRFKLSELYRNFFVDNIDNQHDSFKDHWDPSFNHVKHLFNSLYHADVCVNIASTLTLDALVCGTQVLNIKFDLDNSIDSNYSVKRLYESDYISEIVNSGGSWVAEDKNEFLRMLREILNNKKKPKEDIISTIQYLCYKNDGKSSERIYNYLIHEI